MVSACAPWLAAAGLLGALVTWNASRFTPGLLTVRTKDLSYLPSPELARMLALGQAGAVSKLEWIDSFAYFELQLERKNDAVSGGGQGFDRLYAILTTLDPDYEPFYQHAAFNIGAVMNRHDRALGFLLLGLMELPHATALWRQAAVELLINYDYEAKHPELMEAFLTQWADSEPTANDKQLVWEWSAAMARRRYRGLDQLPYWQEQLARAQPGSSTAAFIELTMRDQLVRFCLTELQALADAYRAAHPQPPSAVADLLEPSLLADRYPKNLPAWGPFTIEDGRLHLRCDPYGFPFEIRAGRVISRGHERERARRKLIGINIALTDLATTSGSWPTSIAAIAAAGLELSALPDGCAYVLKKHALEIDSDPPPRPPWPLGRTANSPGAAGGR